MDTRTDTHATSFEYVIRQTRGATLFTPHVTHTPISPPMFTTFTIMSRFSHAIITGHRDAAQAI